MQTNYKFHEIFWESGEKLGKYKEEIYEHFLMICISVANNEMLWCL